MRIKNRQHIAICGVALRIVVISRGERRVPMEKSLRYWKCFTPSWLHECVITWISKYVKCPWAVHLRFTYFIVCISHLNKKYSKKSNQKEEKKLSTKGWQLGEQETFGQKQKRPEYNPTVTSKCQGNETSVRVLYQAEPLLMNERDQKHFQVKAKTSKIDASERRMDDQNSKLLVNLHQH